VADGTRIAAGKGRKGERLALHNVTIPAAVADAGAQARGISTSSFAPSPVTTAPNATSCTSPWGCSSRDAEIEPNDNPTTRATEVHDGSITGFLPVGDVDYFRYVGRRPARSQFRGFMPFSRARETGGRAAERWPGARGSGGEEAQADGGRGANITSLGEPLLVRLSQGRGDGNPNEPYLLKISSVPMPIQKNGATNSPSPLNPD
jgi:hypothetical protein